MNSDFAFLYATAKATRNLHLTLLRQCVPASVVVAGDSVTTTWQDDVKAKMDACERIQAAWIRVVQSLAGLDDDGVTAAGAEMRREIDRTFGSVLGVNL